MHSRLSWRTHAWLPLAAFASALVLLQSFGLDHILANAWFFDVQTMQWMGRGSGAWWAQNLLHIGGRWLVRIVAALAIVAWATSFASERARHWRRPAGFVALAMVLSTAIVGALKAMTNVDCPWDLIEFGGANPFVALFADRADALARAKCFPGAHSSSGFALVCFYFVWRDGSARLARWALAFAIGVWMLFSIGQEARGAHFVSHDLAGAAIVWYVQLALYSWLLRPAATDSVAAIIQGFTDARAEPLPLRQPSKISPGAL